MRTLTQFLESAPKASLTAIHKRILGQQGLLSSSRILQEVLGYLQTPEFLAQFQGNLQSWQLDCMRWIYGSRVRGFAQSELMAAVPREYQAELVHFLRSACEHLALYRHSHQGSFVYYGFQDFAHAFVQNPLEIPVEPNSRWYHHGMQLFWHLVRSCALVQHGQLRLTSAGELHRRSQTTLEDSFLSTKLISEGAPSDERVLLLEFLSEQGWLLHREGAIHLSDSAWESLTQHPGRLRHHFFQWWLLRRTGLSAHDFRKWIAHWPTTMDLGSLGGILWPLTPTGKAPHPQSASHAWSSLPRILRELWLFGMVEFNLEKGRHSRVRLTAEAVHWCQNGTWESELLPTHPPVGTPNFEAVLPVTSPTRFLFTAACMAEVLGDDGFIRLRFTKENTLAALRSGLPPAWIPDFLEWAKLPSGVLSAIDDWRSVHCGAQIRAVQILRIIDSAKWLELAHFPQFLQHTEESIPGWGFVMKQGHEKPIRELLGHFGLEPPDEPDHKRGLVLAHGSWNHEFGSPPAVQGAVDYDWQPAEVRSAVANALSVQSKYSTDFQQFDPSQTLKVLRYAMVMEVPIEAVILDPAFPKVVPQPQILQVLRINNRREPYRIAATQQDGTPFDFTMDQIQKLRLTSV